MKKTIALLLSCVLTLGLVACGPPSAPAGAVSAPAAENSTTSAPAASATESGSGALEPAEIQFWDLRVEDPGLGMIEKIIADFETANPGVTVVHTAFNVEDLRNTIKPAINSGEGPDIFSYDAGAGYLGVLASSGLAMNLTPYAEKYGWGERFHDWALAKTTYNNNLYGIGNELEMLGVFYNKQIFADAGVAPANTYEEFLALCETFKGKSVTPVILDDKDQWPGFHYESVWMNSFAGVDKVKAAVNGEIAWTDPAFALALDEFQKFVQAGYCTQNPLGLGYDDANKLFVTGEGAMRITGTWQIGGFEKDMGDNVGFFYLPPAGSDVADCPPGGLGEAVVMNAKTDVSEQAAAFMDFMFRYEQMQTWYEAGLIPSVADVDYNAYAISPLFKEIVDEINSAENLGENIDVLMPPKVNDVTKNFMQQLIAGQITGAECMVQKDAALQEEIAAGNYGAEE